MAVFGTSLPGFARHVAGDVIEEIDEDCFNEDEDEEDNQGTEVDARSP